MNWITRLRVASVAVLALAASFASAAQAPPPGTDKPRSVLVFGGSGQLGSEIVRALLAKNYEVAVFLRPTSSRSRIEGLPVRLIEGDALSEADVRRAFESRRFDVVVDALARSESGVEFYATTGRLIAKWARDTGVRQAILHSSIGVGESRKAYPAERYDSFSTMFAAKGTAEQSLIDSGMAYTILRNGVLRDLPPGAADRAQLVEDQGRFGVVSRTGLARLTVQCIEDRACERKIFHAIDETLPMPERRPGARPEGQRS